MRFVGIGVQTDAAVSEAAHRRPKTLGSLKQLLLRLQQAVRLPGPAPLRRLQGRLQAPGQGRRRRRRKLRLRPGAFSRRAVINLVSDAAATDAQPLPMTFLPPGVNSCTEITFQSFL